MRNRYLDLLRAAAIVRVIVYHLFGWPWLSIVLPAMGIMFALAGSLTAASLDKRAAGKVVTSRLRRLLPPMWLLGLVVVPVMLVAGWRREVSGEHPFSLPGLALWILPVGDPPGSDAGIDAWEPLWYIRAYVWFILLSPLLYALYRRVGWAAVAAPIALLAVLDLTGVSLPGTVDAAVWDFVTYGACWVAGFAHHDGRLARLKPWLAYPVALALGAAALAWLHGHQGEDAWDLNDVSESQALWSIAFVLLVLRWQPPMGWLARARPLDRLVTLLNARAVTVYLWHNIAIAAVWPVLTLVALDDLAGDLGYAVDLAAALVLTVVAVLFFGWAEDLAARRAPRLWPSGSGALRAEAVPAGSGPVGAFGPVGWPIPADSGPVGRPIPVDSGPVGRPGPDGPGAVGAAGAAGRLGPDGPAPVDAVGRAGVSGSGRAVPVIPGRPDAGSYSAAAAMSRRPGAWPPASRPAVDPAGGRHAAPDDAREAAPGMPVAGRCAEPVEPPLVGEVLDGPDWFRRHPGR